MLGDTCSLERVYSKEEKLYLMLHHFFFFALSMYKNNLLMNT